MVQQQTDKQTRRHYCFCDKNWTRMWKGLSCNPSRWSIFENYHPRELKCCNNAVCNDALWHIYHSNKISYYIAVIQMWHIYLFVYLSKLTCKSKVTCMYKCESIKEHMSGSLLSCLSQWMRSLHQNNAIRIDLTRAQWPRGAFMWCRSISVSLDTFLFLI